MGSQIETKSEDFLDTRAAGCAITKAMRPYKGLPPEPRRRQKRIKDGECLAIHRCNPLVKCLGKAEPGKYMCKNCEEYYSPKCIICRQELRTDFEMDTQICRRCYEDEEESKHGKNRQRAEKADKGRGKKHHSEASGEE